MAHFVRVSRVLATLGALLAVVLGAPRPAVADDTLTFVLGSVPTLMDTLNLVAQQAGFYTDEHLIIQRVTVKGGAEALDSCASGATDICPMAVEALFTGYEQGIHAQFFLARAALYTYVLAVPVDSPIASLTDFKGKSIGVHIVSPTPLAGQAAVTSMLANAGLKDSDYTFVTIGFNADALNALQSKRVDAAAFPAYELIPFQIAGVQLRTFYHPLLKNVVNAGYAASPAIIQTKADALRRFSRAIVKASLLVRLNPTAAARLALTAHGAPFTDADVDVYARELALWQDALPANDPTSLKIGYIPIPGEQVYSKLLAQYGITKAPVPVSAIVTNQFVDFANDFDHNAFIAHIKSLR